MWSHYSASHTGFCIGFDDDFVRTIGDVALAGSVQYRENVPLFNFFTDPKEEFAHKIFFTKHVAIVKPLCIKELSLPLAS
ncbi:DUF2971 domain-containing protein [Klebsiella pneumoniae]|uniref:DUF2971 domain-containing protein n=1 Tax=Klebsiella pneumoniae TaxID=573 RepID=UPI0021D24521|nr:DUF2971 domain-containing protein [Klebsiella pneumoniae]MCU4703326.1 DUF2971 domain-containing protein [Klebsiella pneumoniae]